MVIKIGILEIGFHTYKLPDFCRILEDHELYVFTTKEGKIILETELSGGVDLSNIIKQDKESWKEYFDKVESYTNTLDAIITLTTHYKPTADIEFMNFHPKCVWIGWMHNAKQYNISGETKFESIVNFMSFLTEYTPGWLWNRLFRQRVQSFFRPLPLKNADSLIVMSSQMKKYLYDNNWGSPVDIFYPAIYTQNSSLMSSTSDKMKIVIPGRVSQKLRDYFGVLKYFESQNNDLPLKIVLLGGTNITESSLRDYCKKLSGKNLLKCYLDQQWISDTEFNQQMKSADIILSPLQKTVKRDHGTAKEVYGKTKASGVIWDAIQYGKPLMLPSFYQENHPLLESMIHHMHGTEELCQKLLEISKKEPLREELKKNARSTAKNFILKKQKDRMEELLIERVRN